MNKKTTPEQFESSAMNEKTIPKQFDNTIEFTSFVSSMSQVKFESNILKEGHRIIWLYKPQVSLVKKFSKAENMISPLYNQLSKVNACA
ncbi:hypothetical protein F8M41_025804 [Gigaspora margarita]|uniref:Uncharacterized protein n=1 Tax=Gigaspora margarita TaxID=4874 RepID=A0A8H4AZY0_GIGMA|nr:hypothetical protein F8M41_025804 [Gigaspora margarita]